ncbi:hypothetical protein JTB14_015121 [Gonioctena quinquepunctata]|nr:hypothetical protein JTB14_015121 [Gonioctena quinquepunctata]
MTGITSSDLKCEEIKDCHVGQEHEIIIHQQDAAQVDDPEINQGLQDQQENQEEIVGDDEETPHIQRKSTRERHPPKLPDGMILYQALLTAEMMHEYPEEPDTVEEALSSYNKKHWEEAMNEELRSLNENQVWELVDPPQNRRIIKSKLLDESTGRISISRDVKILEDNHSGYHQSKTIENTKNHEPQKIDDEVEIFVKNKKEDVTSDEIFGEQEIFDEGETEDIISGEMHTYNEGEKKDENSNSKKNKKMKNCKGDTIKLRRSERNNKDTGYYKNRNSNDDKFINEDIYRSAIGALLYLSVNTRPDICVATSILGTNVSDPYTYDWSEVKRILKYLNGTIDMEIKLGKRSSDIDEDILYGYADADWAGDRSDRKSNSGYLIKFMGAMFDWRCKEQTCVALSSTEAEFISLSEASQQAIYLKGLLQDFQQDVTTTVMFEDNQSCLKLLDNEKMSDRIKHIETKYNFVKNLKLTNKISKKYIPSFLLYIFLLPL